MIFKINSQTPTGSQCWCFDFLDSFHVTGLFQYPLTKSENLWFCDVSRGIEKKQWYGIGLISSLNKSLVVLNRDVVKVLSNICDGALMQIYLTT